MSHMCCTWNQNQSSARTACALNYCATSLAPQSPFSDNAYFHLTLYNVLDVPKMFLRNQTAPTRGECLEQTAGRVSAFLPRALVLKSENISKLLPKKKVNTT